MPTVNKDQEVEYRAYMRNSSRRFFPMAMKFLFAVIVATMVMIWREPQWWLWEILGGFATIWVAFLARIIYLARQVTKRFPQRA